jgi:hypothetical protein
VNVRARVAFATGVAGLAGALLTLTGRIDGSVALALLFCVGARAAVPGSLAAAGPVLAAQAERSLVQQARLAPAWALVAVVGVVRAGSASLADIRGANAVAGLAIARGSIVTVAAAWLAVAAGVVAIASYTSLGARTESAEGASAVIAPPVTLRRLEIGAVLAQAALLVTLFGGPQVVSGADAAWWIAGVGGVSLLAWRARWMAMRDATWIALAASGAAVLLALAGGSP